MRKILFLLTLTIAFFSFTSMAWAEKYYFYKEVGKEIPKGQRYDSYYLAKIKEKFPEGLFVSFLLPGEPRNTHNEFSLGLDCAIDPKSGNEGSYWFFVEELSVGDGKKVYPLNYNVGNVVPTESRYKKLTAYQVVEGKVNSRHEVEIKSGDPSLASFTFKADQLPKQLYLDYKFRIRKEGGPEEVFDGTIPMELASYNVGPWEKTRW